MSVRSPMPSRKLGLILLVVGGAVLVATCVVSLAYRFYPGLIGCALGAGLLVGAGFCSAIETQTQVLQEQSQFLDGLVDSLPGVFYLFDDQGRFLRWNKNFEQVSGYSAEEIARLHPRDFFDGQAQQYIEERIRDVFVQGQATAEAELVAKDKTRRPYFFTGVRVTSRGQPCVVGMGMDITERKAAEQRFQQLNLELEQRVHQRTAQLEAANKELEAFSFSVSHDLRAPLRHIDGYVGLLRRSVPDTLSEESRHYLETISDCARHMGRLIDNLLVFSRMSSAQLRHAEVDLGQLVQESILALEPELQGRRILWKRHPLPAAYADPAMLRQVWINLLSNAVKYTRPRPQAEIEIGCVADSAQELVLFVRDNGVGFDMKYADKLFGVFQRLHSDAEFDGTGIGLAHVRRIIGRHGGRTWAESQLNAGATFYFSLPAASSTSSVWTRS